MKTLFMVLALLCLACYAIVEINNIRYMRKVIRCFGRNSYPWYENIMGALYRGDDDTERLIIQLKARAAMNHTPWELVEIELGLNAKKMKEFRDYRATYLHVSKALSNDWSSR